MKKVLAMLLVVMMAASFIAANAASGIMSQSRLGRIAGINAAAEEAAISPIIPAAGDRNAFYIGILIIAIAIIIVLIVIFRKRKE